jgi:hypothetical protein
MTELFNPDEKAGAGMERDRLYATYVQYVRGLSDHRQNQFTHFITLHLFLLPAHAALLSKKGFEGFTYSVLVALLGMTICYISYQLISAKFARIDAAYKEIHKIEVTMPYRFFTVLAESMGDGKPEPKGYHFRVRKMELLFHWIVGLIYFSMPILHYNVDRLNWLLDRFFQ